MTPDHIYVLRYLISELEAMDTHCNDTLNDFDTIEALRAVCKIFGFFDYTTPINTKDESAYFINYAFVTLVNLRDKNLIN